MSANKSTLLTFLARMDKADVPGADEAKRDALRLLRALRELSSYTGGSDTPKSHPCRKASDELDRYRK